MYTPRPDPPHLLPGGAAPPPAGDGRTLGATSVGGEELLVAPTVVRAGREGVPSSVGVEAGVTAAAVLLRAAS
ncbi:hypothetical protein E2C01_069808 [Portunus trituberculatus]|uniref:Uncharacterized protein n=1 Tax=Portunus trituberculatus TaxID=210409 RepID=A0A5B7HR18_PORTR|nr:hypothetical protein [Portunus trituberculatus]